MVFGGMTSGEQVSNRRRERGGRLVSVAPFCTCGYAVTIFSEQLLPVEKNLSRQSTAVERKFAVRMFEENVVLPLSKDCAYMTFT